MRVQKSIVLESIRVKTLVKVADKLHQSTAVAPLPVAEEKSLRDEEGFNKQQPLPGGYGLGMTHSAAWTWRDSPAPSRRDLGLESTFLAMCDFKEGRERPSSLTRARD